MTEEDLQRLPPTARQEATADEIMTKPEWEGLKAPNTGLAVVSTLLEEAEETGNQEIARQAARKLQYTTLKELVERNAYLERQWIGNRISRQLYNT